MSDLKVLKASGLSSYEVRLGRGLVDEVAPALGSLVRKVLLVYPEPLEASASYLADRLRESNLEIWQFPVADGEDAKTDRWLSIAWSSLGQAGFSRSDAVVSLGGGSVTDLAGFIASTWLRGIGVIHVPTTLLAMVDAAIGGKTGINTLEGKNLVGSFYDPKAIIVDLDALESLPKIELASGFAEIVKCGFIADPTILQLIQEDIKEATNPSSERFASLVEKAIAVKINVVGQDFKESSLREILNYGHTLGHSIELAEHFKIRHGHAVSIGMVFAAELARLSGKLSDDVADLHRTVLSSLGLPVSYPIDRWNALYKGMQIDKKSRAGILRFIVLEDLARPVVLEAVTEEILFQAFQELAS